MYNYLSDEIVCIVRIQMYDTLVIYDSKITVRFCVNLLMFKHKNI